MDLPALVLQELHCAFVTTGFMFMVVVDQVSAVHRDSFYMTLQRSIIF